MPTAVLLVIPIYSSATGLILIAEAMLFRVVAFETSLALMMSVVALSLFEIQILR